MEYYLIYVNGGKLEWQSFETEEEALTYVAKHVEYYILVKGEIIKGVL